MRRKPPFVFTAAVLVVAFGAFISVLALAHAEHDKVRYVAENGSDSGRCDQPSEACQTIAYAAKQAGKGDHIHVAQGRYEITDVDSIFYLSSNLVPVTGGYQQKTFAKPSDASAAGKSILIGVPAEFAQGLAEKGFQVISDSKGLKREQQAYLNAKQTQLAAMAETQSGVPCRDGKSGEFSCHRLDLLAHLPLATLGNNNSGGNDIWGHYDLNDGREYALVGLTNGVSVVEVSDPLNPRVVSFIAGQNTIWRDLKTYQYFDHNRRRWQSYAYVTADAASAGTLILDLTQLPDRVLVAASEKTDASAHNIYISNVDYSTGVALTGRTAYLHIAGSDKQGGAFNSYSLANPIEPQAVYKNAASGRSWYSHDVASFWITDQRRAQCVDGNNDCDLLLDYNENEILLWDKTRQSAPSYLSRTQYQYLSYVHSGWWTEDTQFISVHDELDEINYNLSTRVRFFAIDNLRAPVLAGEYIGPTAAIDHNGYVRGNRYYISNYERGLVVLDITDPREPREVGFFDTYPIADSASFNGAWGTYPFLPSGNILVSDINSGLFILREQTASSAGQASFVLSQLQVQEGENLQLQVQRTGASEGAVSVFYETQVGNADEADYSPARGRLDWLDGDSSAKTIAISIAADGAGNEFSERFFVRLYNPREGLSLAAPAMTQITITDLPEPPLSSSSAATRSAPNSGPSSGGGSGSLGFIALVFLLLLNRVFVRGTLHTYVTP